ncbi:hypothetical protein [Microterricola pindariensis]|uniref:Integral membrane protein n=1 Tax=Microterricola pindariensis TaxID=478010 RepID=A0ABX5AY13_9MICO|nr:hypothetical protein [Microterricola pindariensis]PPL19358.1 hypothetical protein GY24_06600 [Microterricola pindariensis]
MSMFQFVLLHEYVNTATTVIVPLGIALHYWRGAEAQGIAGPQLLRARFASVLLCAAILLSAPGGPLPNRGNFRWDDFLTALVVATLCIAILLPSRRRPTTPDAPEPLAQLDLRPRSIGSFTRPWWLVSWGASAALLATAVVSAGLLSSPDGLGRYTELVVPFGTTGYYGSSSIVGWYFGVPIICATLALCVATWLALAGVAHPRLGQRGLSVQADAAARRSRMRTILAFSSGALLVTLAMVLSSLGGTAQLLVSFPAGDAGFVSVGTPIAALAMPLTVASFLARGLGIALVLLPLFSRRASPAHSRPVGTPRSVTGAENGSRTGVHAPGSAPTRQPA